MATSIGGTGAVEPDISVVVQTWVGAPDTEAGTWELIVTSAGYDGGGMVPGICTVGATEPECVNPPADTMIHGTWQFQFELPKPVGAVVSTAVSDTVGQGHGHPHRAASQSDHDQRQAGPARERDLRRLLVLQRRLACVDPARRHHVRSRTAPTTSRQDPADQGPHGDENEFDTEVGSDDAAGTWQIEIPAIDYHEAGENDPAKGIRVAGPWTLTVTVP